MGQPAAKQGDQITGTDIHIVLVPSASGSTPASLPHPFLGLLDGSLSHNVNIMHRPAAIVGSTATNSPPHIPTPPGVSFQIPPTNQGRVTSGSGTVMINGRPAARNGDSAQTCGEPPNTQATIVAAGTVMVG